MKVLDLFSGIGGFSLGLERAGMETVAFCEIDPYAQRILNKHWPHVPIYEDVTKLTSERLKEDGIGSIDLVTGGFPCQDISLTGRQAGIDGDRSGLWSQLRRIISEVRPRYALMENVPGLLSGDRGHWFGRVLGDLAQIGYDAEWECIPAAAVGAPHIRDRVWILAYPSGQQWDGHADLSESYDVLSLGDNRRAKVGQKDSHLIEVVSGVHPGAPENWWRSQSTVERSANGIPDRLDRLRVCGNSIVPQIAELIGRSIMQREAVEAIL